MINELMPIIIPVLALIESSGDPNAVNGDAVGILQIRPVMVEECNRIWNMRTQNSSWALEHRQDFGASKDMCRLFLTYWLPRKSINYLSAPLELKQEKIVETAARLWLGGSSKGFDSQNAKDHGHKAAYIFRLLKQTKKLAMIADKMGMDTEAFCFSQDHEANIIHKE